MKSPFSFLNYREYLKEALADLQARGLFSHRRFAESAGFGSPNFVLLVMQGRRNLSESGARKVAKALKLNTTEAKYFVKLVLANQATTLNERVSRMETLIRDADFLKVHPLSETQFDYYKHWYNIPVRELVLVNPQATAKWISSVLHPAVDLKDVGDSLKLLEKLGMIRKNPAGWQVQDPVISSGNEVISAGLLAYHQEMIRLARESLDRFRGAEREVSSATLVLSEKNFALAREKIRALKRELLALGEEPQEAEHVYQINFQLFPLSRSLKPPREKPS